jgi:DNA-binding GntR family transcriptional regulator
MADPDYRTKKDVVVELIREAILSAEYKPGDRLLQQEIAKRLNFSPTPVREALRQLEAEGVLDHSPHRGVRVVEAKMEDVREIYLIRAALESLATREAVPNITRAEIARLRELQSELETLSAEGHLQALRKLNFEFHMRVYKASGMAELYHLIQNLWTKFPWDTLHVLPGRAASSVIEHSRVIQAIAEGNAELAGHRVQEHIEQGGKALMEYLAAQADQNAATTDTN